MIKKPNCRLIFFGACLIIVNSLAVPAVFGHSITGVKKKSLAKNYLNQQSQVKGMVTDEDGTSLAGVSVLIKGTSLGTTTDSKGNYTLEAKKGQTVVFSIVGYETREIVYNGQAHLNVQLSVTSKSLNEVVVNVGYGTQKKVSLTSAVSQISGKELVRRPVSSIQQALQGKLPGLTIFDKGGSPGSPNTHIVVRGVNTLYTSEDLSGSSVSPLVLIDGVEQPYGNINPNDIESISVLKDASSTAIYGSRALTA